VPPPEPEQTAAPAQAPEEPRRWRGLFDHLPALVAFWDKDLRNVVANRAYSEWLGVEPEDMVGRHVSELFQDPVYPGNLPRMRSALAGHEQQFDSTIVTPAGRTVHTQVTYTPELVGEEVVGFYVMVTDVTDQVDARRDLEVAQELGGMGSYTIEPRSGVLSFSPQLLRMAGWDPSGPSPSLEEWLRLVHPADKPKVDAALARADEGLDYETSYRILLDDGSVRHVHSKTRRVLDEHGEVVFLRGVMQDETETQRTAKSLEVANSLLTDLIGLLGHDLRQPIAVVRGNLELVDDCWEDLDEDDLRRHLRSAAQAAGRMDALLTDILKMVDLDSKTLAIRPTAIPIADLLRELAAEAAVEMSIEAPDDLGAYGDRAQVRQILTNLVSNASRYGAPPFVLEASRDGDRTLVSVRDGGEGVPEEFVPLLFDRFTRASTGVATKVGGNGLGLFLVQRLADANDGSVTYRAQEPAGSVFTLQLPSTRPSVELQG
jgi:PAS domain S-box-containing protein